MKIKATINEVICANNMINTLRKAGYDADGMLRVIKLSRQLFNEKHKGNVSR